MITQHMNLQCGLFANFNGKHFVGELGRSKKNSWNSLFKKNYFQNKSFV